jgi:DNA-binding beta-propeller fold protein YncE
MLATKLRSATASINVAWDLAYAYYDPPKAWDVSTASFLRTFSVFAQEEDPSGIFFKPDGTKMYILGRDGYEVNEYNLSTAWDVSTASFLQRFSVFAQDSQPEGLFFKPDGTKMYIVGSNGDEVNEYNLSTAWDVSTASFLQIFSVAAQDTNPTDIFFKPDGTKMYILGNLNDNVNEYDLSTAWDISTASFLQSFIVAQESQAQGIFFKTDGTKMYITGETGDDVNEYNLSTAWDVSTATFLQLFSVAAQDTSPQSIFFKPDGTKMYVVGLAGSDVNEYTLGGFSVAAQDTEPAGIFFKPDGTKMYIVGFTGRDVNEYNLSTAWDVSTASFLQIFSVSAQEISPQDIFFKPDGTKMYIVGSNGDEVNEYNLSTAWNVSTASFLQLFSVSAQETFPSGLFFKPDGTKMYIVGTVGDDVNEYNLSTAWNISTASFLQLFSVAAQDIAPRGISFKDDGTKMYIVGNNGKDVNEYNLSTAWDVSTASFLQLFSVAAQETNPTTVFFKPNGTKMYIVGNISDAVYQYSIGIQE